MGRGGRFLMSDLRHSFLDSRFGQLHLAEAGDQDAPLVVCLHQTPRSWDEYRDVLPLLGARFHAVALDSVGYGWSSRPAGETSIERLAAGVVDVLDALGARPGRAAHLVGHHTGGVVAVEVAAAMPEAVASITLSGTPWVDAERREKVKDRPPIDHVVPAADGTHLLQLWRNRLAYYPADRPDLTQRLVLDALAVLDHVEEGHYAVNAYRMEDRIGLVRAPAQVLCGELDAFSLPDVDPLLAQLPTGTRAVVLSGVGVAAVDHDPAQFAAAVEEFVLTHTAADAVRV